MIDPVHAGGAAVTLRPASASLATAAAVAAVAASSPVKPASLSTLAAEIKRLAEAPPIDAARVVALRSALQSGHYAADPQAIASAMIELDRGSRG